jgi:hypothetical protein
MHLKHKFWLFAFLVMFAGCAGLTPTVTAKTPAQIALSAYGVYTAVENTITDQLVSGVISVDKAKEYQGQFKKYRQTLETGAALAKSGLTIPQTQLEAIKEAQTILLQIQRDLQAKEKP